MYPAFGLLSQRLMKREPLSYTFIEPDKRVVKSLQRVAQAAEDNAIGVRLIRTEPMEDLFGRFHYDSAIRNREPSPDWLLAEERETETVVVSNAPFWCTYLTLQKLCIDCSLGDGFFKGLISYDKVQIIIIFVAQKPVAFQSLSPHKMPLAAGSCRE